MSKHCLGLALSIACLAAVMAQAVPASGKPAIQNVRRFAQQSATDASPVRLELSKFIEDATHAGETFRVRWSPGERGLSEGAVLRFHYRQAEFKETQALEIRYPFAVRNIRTATFEISPKAVRRGGEVVAWRVELRQHGQLLAEKSSDFRK